MGRPDFIIIGAMKCGTSTLYEQLDAQPGVFMCRPKEPNFFSDDDVYRRGVHWYEKLFDDAPADAVAGEASTHYAKLPTHPDTIDRLASGAPNAKFVYMMRHPIDRLVSHYIHDWSQRRISAPIDEALADAPELIEYGRYAYQIKPWLDRFGTARVLPVFLERLTAAPAAEFARIGAFLSPAADFVWRDDLEPANVSAARIRPFPAYGLVVDNPVATALRRALTPRSLRDRVKQKLRLHERPALGCAARARAVEAFDADLAALGAMLGRPLDCANFKETVTAAPLVWAS